EVDCRPLVPTSAADGNFDIEAVRDECRFDVRMLPCPDGTASSRAVAVLNLITSDLSEVYYERFAYRVDIPVKVTSHGSHVGAGNLSLVVRKPLITQYPSVHFGRTCRPNQPAVPRHMWIRTVPDVLTVV